MSWHGNIKAEKLHEQNLKSMSGGFFVQADQYQGSSLHNATSIFRRVGKEYHLFVCFIWGFRV